MRIKMKIMQSGSPNGINVIPYYAGQEYDVPESLGESFVKQGVAIDLAKPAEEDKEEKALGGSSANKDAGQSSRRVGKAHND
jgi:hypothetical protein